jgi:hypothetical protein
MTQAGIHAQSALHRSNLVADPRASVLIRGSTTTGSHVPLFLVAGSAYLLMLVMVLALAPKLEPAQSDVPPAQAL